MKKNIHIAYLRRKIRQVEEDWPFFLQRIADFTPEQKRLAIKLVKSALESLRTELQQSISSES